MLLIHRPALICTAIFTRAKIAYKFPSCSTITAGLDASTPSALQQQDQNKHGTKQSTRDQLGNIARPAPAAHSWRELLRMAKINPG